MRLTAFWATALGTMVVMAVALTLMGLIIGTRSPAHGSAAVVVSSAISAASRSNNNKSPPSLGISGLSPSAPPSQVAGTVFSSTNLLVTTATVIAMDDDTAPEDDETLRTDWLLIDSQSNPTVVATKNSGWFLACECGRWTGWGSRWLGYLSGLATHVGLTCVRPPRPWERVSSPAVAYHAASDTIFWAVRVARGVDGIRHLPADDALLIMTRSTYSSNASSTVQWTILATLPVSMHLGEEVPERFLIAEDGHHMWLLTTAGIRASVDGGRTWRAPQDGAFTTRHTNQIIGTDDVFVHESTGMLLVASTDGLSNDVRFTIGSLDRWPATSNRVLRLSSSDKAVPTLVSDLLQIASPNLGKHPHVARTREQKLWVAAADTGTMERWQLVSAATCRPEDVVEGCDANTAPLVSTCTPKAAGVLASACVRLLYPQVQGVVAMSSTDGLNFKHTFRLTNGMTQSVPMALAINDVAHTTAVAYLALPPNKTLAETEVRLAVFDQRRAILLADVLAGTIAADEFSYRDHRVAVWPMADRMYGLVYTNAKPILPERAGNDEIVDIDPTHQSVLREVHIVF